MTITPVTLTRSAGLLAPALVGVLGKANWTIPPGLARALRVPAAQPPAPTIPPREPAAPAAHTEPAPTP